MYLVFLAFSLFAEALSPADPALRQWTDRVGACLGRGEAEVFAAEAAPEVLAFSCGTGDGRLVVMANASEVPQRLRRETTEPLVPVFATRGDVAAVPSLLITLFEEGGVGYSNEIPARTAVVFRPARPDDVRPRGLVE
jgi:hypothetical protein